jgi:hypothetical protein
MACRNVESDISENMDLDRMTLDVTLPCRFVLAALLREVRAIGKPNIALECFFELT